MFPVYLDHLHVLAPGQVDPEQRVLLVPSVADHRHGGYSPPHEAAAVNLMSDHINKLEHVKGFHQNQKRTRPEVVNRWDSRFMTGFVLGQYSRQYSRHDS